ncbi:MAG: hypothetical protein RB191_25110 [Terriglobia bacterium]|nr:hypothetical protein [Terriglobia bacterium]
MAALSVTFTKELSQPLTDIYWDAMKAMPIEQFQEAAKSYIKHSKHFPRPAELLERFKDMTSAAPKPFAPLPPADHVWLSLVNGMFVKYLSKRRLEEGFRGDINMAERRAECHSLAEFFKGIAAEGDEEATEEQLKLRFDRAMDRIQDAVSREATPA